LSTPLGSILGSEGSGSRSALVPKIVVSVLMWIPLLGIVMPAVASEMS
jgi:hypothetical protein